eukprot:TRINITY_DN27845_c0_g2_i1.p2 TRINITY_DN27845_c0_g2~~TRINITY_DN27845_c0_g2_i1.p2  ORF type:complete len:173 (+),score=44.84 TRINITY_DN27845_c0_g2_i1:127-645(+)
MLRPLDSAATASEAPAKVQRTREQGAKGGKGGAAAAGSKRGAHKKEKEEELVNALAKLVLSECKQNRATRAIVMQVFLLPSDLDFVAASKKATRAFAELAKQKKQKGQPHCYVWNGFVRWTEKVTAQSVTEGDGAQDNELIKGYMAGFKDMNEEDAFKEICTDVRHSRLAKT